MKSAAQDLDHLAAAHLVVRQSAGWYTMHDLFRQYAASLAIAEDDDATRTAARHRLYDWFSTMSVAATELVHPEFVRLPSARAPFASVAGVVRREDRVEVAE